MSKCLCRQSGKYQWNATVSATRLVAGNPVEIIRLTVFSDDRGDAVRDVCDVVNRSGYSNATVNHITRIG